MTRLNASVERPPALTNNSEVNTATQGENAASPILPPKKEQEKLSSNSADRQRNAIPALTSYLGGLVQAITPGFLTKTELSLDSLPPHLAPVKDLIEKWQVQCTPDMLAKSFGLNSQKLAPGTLEVYQNQFKAFTLEAAHDKTFQEFVMKDQYRSGDLVAGGKDFVKFVPKDFDSGGKIEYVPANGDHGRSDGFVKTAKFGPDNQKAHLMVAASIGHGGSGMYTPSWSLNLVGHEEFKATPRGG